MHELTYLAFTGLIIAGFYYLQKSGEKKELAAVAVGIFCIAILLANTLGFSNLPISMDFGRTTIPFPAMLDLAVVATVVAFVLWTWRR